MHNTKAKQNKSTKIIVLRGATEEEALRALAQALALATTRRQESAAHHFLSKTLLEIPETSFSNEISKLGLSKKNCMWRPKSPGIDLRKITFRNNGYIFLARHILRILICGVILTFHVHSVFIWCLKYFLPHICVELETLPFGLPGRNDRGECCVPFPS